MLKGLQRCVSALDCRTLLPKGIMSQSHCQQWYLRKNQQYMKKQTNKTTSWQVQKGARQQDRTRHKDKSLMGLLCLRERPTDNAMCRYLPLQLSSLCLLGGGCPPIFTCAITIEVFLKQYKRHISESTQIQHFRITTSAHSYT